MTTGFGDLLWTGLTRAAGVCDPFATSVRPRVLTRRSVLSEQLFAQALSRECHRADRHRRPFVLLAIEPRDPARSISAVATAVDLACGELQMPAVIAGRLPGGGLGMILTDAAACVSRSRVSGAIFRHVARGARRGLRVRWRTYAPASDPRGGAAGIRGVAPPPRPYARYALKRALDVGGSILLLIALAPLLGVLAALVKLTSPGPVLFRQQRIGEGGRPFTMLKFRTMHVTSDEALHQAFVTRFIRATPDLATLATPMFKLTNDPRVTPLGRFLRRSSLDELPQCWNVLRGDMSLVGPRPPLPYEVREYQHWHWRRVLDARPGITGLWQVVGRSRTTFDEMVRLDLRYVRTCSLWSDLRILLSTPLAVLSGKGAA